MYLQVAQEWHPLIAIGRAFRKDGTPRAEATAPPGDTYEKHLDLLERYRLRREKREAEQAEA